MPLREERLVDVLREAPLPATPNDLADRMLSARRRPLVRWTLTGFAAALGAAATVALFLQPTTSLAQVVDASVAAVKVKITNTRTWVRKSSDDQAVHTYQIVTYKNGAEWRHEEHFPDGFRSPGYAVCDGRHSLAVHTTRDGKVVALLDDAYEVPSMFDTVDKLLSPRAKAVVHHNVLWNGQRVDRFDEVMEVETARHVDGPALYRLGRESLEEHIWADPGTHLPIQVQKIRLGGAWGDTWDYDYSDQPASLFKTVPPKGCQVIDLREERKKLEAELPGSGAVVVDPLGNARLLVPPSVWKEGQARKIAVGSLPSTFGEAIPMHIGGRSFSWTGIGYLGRMQLPDRVACTLGETKLADLPVIRLSAEAVMRPFLGAHGVFLR